ncbi:MAG: transporter solute receptor, family [Streptosporangiaceae bacterium]|nr:transporter solute receptor, family [Streptosporangiaceae bacterium]
MVSSARPLISPARPAVMARRTALLAGLWLAGGCALAETGARYRHGPLPIATGGADGVYYLYGRRLAYWIDRSLPEVRTSVDSTTGSVDNLRRLSAGRDGLGFVAADAAGATVSGAPGRVPVRALARLYEDYIHLVVAGSSPVRSIGDLRGRRVSLGSSGSGVELVAGRVLAAAGLRPGRHLTQVPMGLEESAAGLRQGRVDAFFWSGGLPTAGMTRLARQTPIRLIPIGTLAPVIRERSGPYYRAATIPQGTYPGVEATLTLALANYLVAPASLDEELAYRVTEILIRQRDAIAAGVPSAELLDVRDAVQTDPIPLHPGALRYYRSIKK